MSVISTPVPSDQEDLDQPEFAVQDRRITVDGTSIQYLESGAGPPLLLLHGHEQSAAGWRWAIPTLARTHRVVALSLPGHGDTGPATGGYAPDRDLAPFVTGFLDAIGVDTLDVVGHSSGGMVALRLALADPRRVRTLTLVDSAGLGQCVNPLLALDTLPGFGELAILLSRLPGGNLMRATMSAGMLFAQPWRMPAEFFTEQNTLGQLPGQLEASTAMARALFDTHGQREVLLDELPAVTMPTLVIWGGCDYVLPAYQAQSAVDRLPRGRLSVFADCGHLPHVECPNQFAAVLSEFLAEHRPAPAVQRATPPAYLNNEEDHHGNTRTTHTFPSAAPFSRAPLNQARNGAIHHIGQH